MHFNEYFYSSVVSSLLFYDDKSFFGIVMSVVPIDVWPRTRLHYNHNYTVVLCDIIIIITYNNIVIQLL